MSSQSDEWLAWAAYNLALGVPEASVKAELMANADPTLDLDAALANLVTSPGYRAAQRLSRKFKLTCDLNDTLLDLSSQTFDYRDIARVARLSSDDFHHRYYALNRPVIITDVVSRWPAVEPWDLDFLRRAYGDQRVSFQAGRSRDDHRDCFVDHTTTASLAEFIDLMDDVPEGSAPPYLIAHDRLLDRAAFKPLLDDVHFDPRYFDQGDTHGRVFFWLGPKGSATPMHRDLGNVYMAQIRGHKLVKMVPATQIHLVYNEAGYHSDVDFDDPALDDFPLVRKASIMEFVIGPGDLLFVPVGWWHFVKVLDTSITVTGNNFRFPNQLRPIFD